MGDGDGRDDNGFLGRWSRRKRAVRRSATASSGRGGAKPVELARGTPPAPMPPPAADAEARRPAAGDRERSDEKAPADLPAVDELDKDSDYAQFLRKGVPEALKRQALKRLWTSDPQFHVVDPFTEYGGDYTVVVPIDALKDTIYKPGLGYLSEEELEQQKNLRRDEAVAEGEAIEQQADAAGAPAAADASPAGEPAEAAAPAPPPPEVVAADGDKAVAKGREDVDEQADAPPDSAPNSHPGSGPGRR